MTVQELKARIAVLEQEAAAAHKQYAKLPKQEVLAEVQRQYRVNCFNEKTPKWELVNALVDAQYGYTLINLSKRLSKLESTQS